ncbi:GDSL-type esterase/lipase family protein [Paraflavitalea sp. CAU 1676]|uniref:GDSL-type esterase/lipase family protein n=1 Tax=Paraflavitalea sp. CAU 1676 TaxID=3032598 RepID=UPI0023DBBDE0|nr:GDSL-type esterase/lipase family protein [Paraflavitalea sp. CAU 1676]MDF2189639.1 GDSL-type esterase/lipase family protein [Paraflavitalea sp. CAU 1676]
MQIQDRTVLSAGIARQVLRLAFYSILTLSATSSLAQEPPKKIDSSYNNTYYQGRMELFNTLPLQQKGIVFLGNSITERGNWSELLPGQKIMNRGIGGDNTFGVLARLDMVVKANPKKVFLLIGINDLSRALPREVILHNYERIINYIRTNAPKTTLYVQSVLPLYEPLTTAAYLKNKKDSILQLNVGIKALADKYKLTYINLHEVLADGNGDLKKEYTADGIHLRPAAYVLWVDFLRKKKYL